MLSLPLSSQSESGLAAASQAISILTITPQSSLTACLSLHLTQHGYKVATSDSLDATPLSYRHVDIILLDWSSSGQSSSTLCKQIRLVNRDAYIVVLLPAEDATPRRIQALNAGADDSLTMPLNYSELDARLQAYCRRIRANDGDIYRFADLTLNRQTREVYRGQHLIPLTAKEFDLLKYLLRHQQQVMTRDQILEHVWGYDFAGDSNIIEVYIRYLRIKLEVHNPSRLIHTVRYVGYVLREANGH